MKVILKVDLEKLGNAGETVTVKDGYARNYLFPKGFAMIDSPANQKTLTSIFKRSWKIRNDKQKKLALKSVSDWGHLEVAIEMRVGEDGKMFGAVTSSDIAEVIKHQKGIEIDRRKLQLDEPIRSIGLHQIPLKLHSDVHTIIHVKVDPIMEVSEESVKRSEDISQPSDVNQEDFPERFQ